MSKLRPILFQTEMVQANLEDRKTQTRRTKKLENVNSRPNDFDSPVLDSTGEWVFTAERGQPEQIRVKCPYGRIGDVLWVRETFCKIPNADSNFTYKASTNPLVEEIRKDYLKADHDWAKWKPSLHMPFEACRLFLEITKIRVERLHDISRGDAMEEGCPFPNFAHGTNPKNWFRSLWESINGIESWKANPWVWVIEFKRIPKPPTSPKRTD